MSSISVCDKTLSKIQWLCLLIKEQVQIQSGEIIYPTNGLTFDFDVDQMPFSESEMTILRGLLSTIRLVLPSNLKELNDSWPDNIFNMKGQIEHDGKNIINKLCESFTFGSADVVIDMESLIKIVLK
jgi:hypothetical protein